MHDEQPIKWRELSAPADTAYIFDENGEQQAILLHRSQTPTGRTFARRVLLAPRLAEALSELFAVMPDALMHDEGAALAIIEAELAMREFYHGGEGA